MELKPLKIKLKERVALGLNYGIKAVADVLDNDTSIYSELITFKSQFNDLNSIANQNVLPYEQIELGLNKIRRGLMAIIDRIEPGDIKEQKPLAKPKNNEVQFRKSNFFQLLNIHFQNLQGIQIDSTEGMIEGREAIRFTYDAFCHNYKHPRGHYQELATDIVAFSKYFFKNRFEVYMKTVKFILEYITEEELEQDFFIGVFKSILSSFELISIYYYSISGIEPGFSEVLRKSELFDADFAAHLLQKEHLDLLRS